MSGEFVLNLLENTMAAAVPERPGRMSSLECTERLAGLRRAGRKEAHDLLLCMKVKSPDTQPVSVFFLVKESLCEVAQYRSLHGHANDI